VKIFYTYLWLREDGTPYYVGKGSGNRAFVQRRHSFPMPSTRERILVQEFPDEVSAFAAEIFLISFYGREDLGGCLLNLTDGGENPPPKKPGCKGPSEETRKKISETLKKKGIKPPSQLGSKKSEETIEKIRNYLKGHKGAPWTEEQHAAHKTRMLGTHFHLGHIHSEESRRKMSESQKVAQAGRKRTERGTYA
jgi:hypothetical protein